MTAAALASNLRWSLRGFGPAVAGLILLLLAGILPAVFFLFYSSVHNVMPDGAFGPFTLGNYTEILTSRDFLHTFLVTVIYAIGAAVLAIAIGVAQAWLAERTDAPMARYLYLASIISLGIPYVLYIAAWLLCLGKVGPVNELIGAVVGGSGHYLRVNTIGGMIFVEGMMWSPLAFLLLSSVFRNADASFEEAATMSGAGLFSTARHVTFSMARPALFALALLVCIKAAEAFEVPALVGMPGNVSVLTSTIYQRLQMEMPPRLGSASALGIILLVVMAVLLRLYGRITAETHRYRTVTGKNFRPRIIRLGRWRYPMAFMVVAIPFVVIILPLINIVWAALLPYYQPFSIKALSQLSLVNFVKVVHSPSFQDSIVNTLVLGAGTATVVTIVSAFAGWCVGRRIPGGQIIDSVAAMPLVFPAIVLGLAFLEIFSHVGTFLYGSLTALIIVSSVAYLPYGLRYAQMGVIQIHPELEEAARVSGASPAGVFFKVTLPLMVPALISCWLFAFLLAVRAMSMVLLLAGPDSQVIAVALFDMWVNGQIGELAALGCVWTIIITVFSVAFYLVARRYQLSIG
jgi:iron(III) transport system permease protein